jgi:hypothetical protein
VWNHQITRPRGRVTQVPSGFGLALSWCHSGRRQLTLNRQPGVSIYSFIDERHLLFYSTVISAAERESAYVIDGLMHNDVVKSDIHSTDTHGYTETIFGAMHLLGFSYAPRIKDLKRQRLYIFKGRKDADQTDWAVRPSGYIDTELIKSNWDDILRFIATIRLKETTASDLFRRLNSYSKQHVLYRALKSCRAASGHRTSTQQDRELASVLASDFDRQRTRAGPGREAGPGSGRGVQAADQECHRLLELSLPDAEDRRGSRRRNAKGPAGVGDCRFGRLLAPHQPARRV